MSFSRINPGLMFAILAALLFGASTPASKLILPQASPWMVAGLLYAGSGVGLLFLTIVLATLRKKISREEGLRRADLPWMAGATVFGGILGPVFMMEGLARGNAATASLFLNLEGVLTALLAWFAFRESFDRRIALGMLLIFLGSLALSWSGSPTLSSLQSPLLISAACLCWALDNNFTRKISGQNPLQIVLVKSLVAGASNVALALAAGQSFPAAGTIAITAVVGFFGYGASLVCFVLSLRLLGTARTGAYFSIAPFAGTLLALLFLGESATPQLIGAAVLMGAGVWLHLTESHGHLHKHQELHHSHFHFHDDHHAHSHEDDVAKGHSHAHTHDSLHHSHPHFPDIHHRHRHSSQKC